MAQHSINHRVCVFDLCGIKYKHKATSFFPVQVLHKLKNKIKSLEWRLKYYTYFKKALLLKNMASGHSNTPKLGRVFHSIFSTVGLGKAFHWHPPHKTTWRSRTENVLLWRQVSPMRKKRGRGWPTHVPIFTFKLTNLVSPPLRKSEIRYIKKKKKRTRVFH